jgi:hypothetical protein
VANVTPRNEESHSGSRITVASTRLDRLGDQAQHKYFDRLSTSVANVTPRNEESHSGSRITDTSTHLD